MRYILWLTLSLWLPHCQGHETTPPEETEVIDTIVTFTPPEQVQKVNTLAHVDYLRRHIGVPSKDTINMWLASVGLPPNNPFCSAAASYALDVAGVEQPTVRSGLARNFVYQTPKDLQIDANDVYKGFISVPPGYMVVYQRGETRFGHNGFLTDSISGARGVYISANTSAPDSGGSESSGGGVYEKPFSINPYSYFRVTDFVKVIYNESN